MRIRILGSAAGGGFPQWNCACRNCRGVREGRVRATARTQESVAVSPDGHVWYLLNASPEIRQQIESFPPLHPRPPRESPLAGVLLTNGDLDHSLGLLSLREGQPLVVYATERVRAGFTEHNVLYRTLHRFPGQVTWQPLELGREAALRAGDRQSGLSVQALAMPGKLPIHLEGIADPSPLDNIGLRIRDQRTGAVVAYLPSCARVTGEVLAALAGARAVLFDGTFWSSTEMVDQGLGTRTAEDMAHVPIGGPHGSLRALAGLSGKRVFLHINHTNPILLSDSPERSAVRAAGWEVAYDGMEVLL